MKEGKGRNLKDLLFSGLGDDLELFGGELVVGAVEGDAGPLAEVGSGVEVVTDLSDVYHALDEGIVVAKHSICDLGVDGLELLVSLCEHRVEVLVRLCDLRGHRAQCESQRIKLWIVILLGQPRQHLLLFAFLIELGLEYGVSHSLLRHRGIRVLDGVRVTIVGHG